MKRLTLFFVATLSTLLSPWIAAKTLKACGHPFYPPVSWVSNNQLTGLAPAVSQQLFEELGYQIHLITDYNWKRCLREVQLGNADIVVAAYRIPSRETFMYFSEQPLIADPVGLFVNRAQSFKFKELDDLKGKTVGLLLGDSFGEKFDQFMQSHSKIEYVSRNSQNFIKLAMNRIDYMPIGLLSGELQSQKLGFSNQIKALDYQVSTEYYYLGIGHHSQLQQHLPYINRRLQELTNDGTIDKLTKTYSKAYISTQDSLQPEANKP